MMNVLTLTGTLVIFRKIIFMKILPLVQKEFEQEMASTRKMLQRVPPDRFDWKPHEKSMSMLQLTTHLAELPGWIPMALNTTEMDFAKTPYTPAAVNSTEDLMRVFEQSVESGRQSLNTATEDDLLPEWTLRSGDQVFMVMSKYEVIRHSLSQCIHHRAQLGVFLRLLNVAIPGTYGPSADEASF